MDPRLYQIATLSALSAWGLFALDHGIDPRVAGAIAVTAMVTQAAGCQMVRTPFDPKSPLITTLSLILLLRTPSPTIGAIAAAVAIGGKFLLRVRGKHLFNPANLGIVVAILAFEEAWVSPGRWGSAALWAFAIACVGLRVVYRARRADITWAFLATWVGLVVGRGLVLGDPLNIATHRLQSGAFLIFAFFMISDPKTTPDSRTGRIVFAVLVALAAYYGTFARFEPNALLFALAACALATPVLDRVFPGETYSWASPLDAAPEAGSAGSLVG